MRQNGQTPVAYMSTRAIASLLHRQARLLPRREAALELVDGGEALPLEDARGRVVKLISALLKHLPPAYNYKVIFMRRAMPEILASQRQMLIRRGEPADAVPDDKMAAMFNKHVAQVESWLAAQPNIDVLYVSYNEVMKDSRPQAERINLFLGGSLKVEEMVDVVDSGLYRQQHESS